MRLQSSIGPALGLYVLAAAAGAGAQLKYDNAFGNLEFTRPVWVEEFPGKPGQYLVLEQNGGAQVVRQEGNAWTKSEFVKITVTGGTSGGNEQGLLGFAFHPEFTANRKYYLYYCLSSGGLWNILEERQADETLLKDGGKVKDIFKISDPAGNHNGGTIGFGPDGYLYLGTGDGGNQGDPSGHGQNLNTLFAKILRVDVNKQENGKNYGIPSDNPYATGGGAPEVWANGLRNPFRWSFDPETKDLWAGDVGGSYQEEVDLITKGGNYGWVRAEGDRGNTGGIKAPVVSYGRGGGSAIIGGRVYRGDPASPLHGKFLYGDNGSRNMWAVGKDGNEQALTDAPSGPAGFGTDSRGAIFLATLGGIVYRILPGSTATFFPRAGHLRRTAGRVFTASAGTRLDLAAFAAGPALAAHTLGGARAALLAKDNPVVPEGLQAGVYILRAVGASGKHDLLVVR